MTSPEPLPTTVSAVAQLYAAERTAGQDTQRLDFMIFSILLAYIGVVTGWFINASNLPPIVYAVTPLPAVGLVAYLVQLMDLAKVRSASIDYLEGRLRTYANVDSDSGAPLIGSAAEKSVTDVGEVAGRKGVKLLRRGQSGVLYIVAVAGSITWVVGCLAEFLTAPPGQPPQLVLLGRIFFWLTAILGAVTVANIIRVIVVFSDTSGKPGATPDTTGPGSNLATPDTTGPGSNLAAPGTTGAGSNGG